jgi:hypothetical protein
MALDKAHTVVPVVGRALQLGRGTALDLDRSSNVTSVEGICATCDTHTELHAAGATLPS